MEEKYTILGPSLVCQWTGDCNVGTGTSRDPPKKIVVMCKGRSKKEPLASPSTWTGRFTTTSSDCIDIADSLEYIKWLMLKQCDRQSPVVGQYTCLLQPQSTKRHQISSESTATVMATRPIHLSHRNLKIHCLKSLAWRRQTLNPIAPLCHYMYHCPRLRGYCVQSRAHVSPTSPWMWWTTLAASCLNNCRDWNDSA